MHKGTSVGWRRESKHLAGSHVLAARLSVEKKEVGQLVWVNIITPRR